MLNTYLVNASTVELEDGTLMKLEYYVTEEVMEIQGNPLYGIRINKYHSSMTESKDTGAISYSKSLVMELCNKLAQHTVTPIALYEVVEDIISLAV